MFRVSLFCCDILLLTLAEAKLGANRVSAVSTKVGGRRLTTKLAFRAAQTAARDAITRSWSAAIKQRFDDAAGNAAGTWRGLHDGMH